MERDGETESERGNGEKEREKWREREWREQRKRNVEREKGACMQNNAYQFRITLESPRLVHNIIWYL